MHELINKYANVFIKLGKPVAQDIKHITEFLGHKNLIPHHKKQIMSEKKLYRVQKNLQKYIKRLDTD